MIPSSWFKLVQSVIVKGAIISTTLHLLDIAFYKQIIITVISATLTGVFLLLQENRAERRDKQAQQDRDDIKHSLGTDKRKGDIKTNDDSS